MKWPIDYRVLFPLAPAFAVAALSVADISGAAPSPSAAKAPSEPAPAELPPCCQKIPSRSAWRPPYTVKFVDAGRTAVDYDAGSMMVVLNCSFSDLCAEQPVVGISDLALVTRLQTDTGALVEGASGVGIISPAIREFKDAHFVVQAKVPLNTQKIIMLNGALTILRARERSALSWREPFSSELGAVHKANGFELILTKCEVGSDTLVAEWSCKAPAEAAGEAALWQVRQLKASLTCADKTVLNPETGKENPATIRRVFRLNRKFPTALELSFISDLKLENLPFSVTGIMLDNESAKKAEKNRGENF